MRRWRWSLPLRVWLAAAMVAIILVPIASWLGVIIAVQGPLKTSPTPWERRTQERMSDVRQLIQRRGDEWESPAFQQELRGLLADSVISVALLNAKGVPLFLSGSFQKRAEIQDWPSGEPQTLLESAGSSTRIGLVYDSSGEAAGLYAIEQSGVDPFTYVLILTIVGGVTIAMLLAVWWVGRSINEPIKALAQAAKAVSKERLDFAVPSSRIGEVNELATAFASMRDGLQESIRSQAAMDEERRMLIAGIAHDLRTPLASVRGYLEGLRDGIAKTPERMERYVAVALEKTGHLERMISDLFAFAQAEYLEQQPKREATPLGALLQAAADGMAPRALAAGISVQLDLPESEQVIQVDKAMLTRVIENLLENGVRHTPSGGSVTVGFRAESGGTNLWVSDTGPGIPAGDLERIFEPLYRGDEARGTKTGGAGLGLAIARRFVEAHGGRIWATNEGGARFSIWLPCL